MRSLIITMVLLAGIIISANSQEIPKRLYSSYRIETAPVINGDLNDDAWMLNDWEGDFTQFEPYEGRAPSQPTEFKICYDDLHLYIAIKSYDSAPDSITNRMGRRDNGDGDMTFVLIDSYHDLRTGFVFGVSSAGVRFDMIMSNNGRSEDPTWDPIWQAKARTFDWGWAAEMKIPFTQLRFQKNSDEVWGLLIARQIFRHSELSLWQEIPRNAPGFVHAIGEMDGLQGIEPRKQLDITPYTVGSYNTYEAEDGNPFASGRDPKMNAGLDAKIGVTNNLTLDLTLLPDFGQVEADPSQVNLTAFETYFEEQRPFFIEGSSITSFNVGLGDGDIGNDNLFYSRRIGRRPQGYPSLEANEYAKIPIYTNILGAAKLTGKTENGLSVGILESVTSQVKARVDSLGDRSKQIVEPLTNYALARVQKDFNKGNTIIGGAITNVIRNLDGTDMDYLHNNATSAGVDFTQFFNDRNYTLSGALYMSNVQGSENAISRTQLSSARYYQRPDVDHIEYDDTRTSLNGHGGKLEFGKMGGNWNFIFFNVWNSPGLELNDMGFLRQADRMVNVLWTGYNFTEPFSIFRSLNLNNNVFTAFDFGGNLNGIGYEWNISASFKNFWRGGMGGGFGFHNVSNTFLRGGPSMYLPNDSRIRFNLSTDQRKKVYLSFFSNFNSMAEGASNSSSYNLSLTIRPSNSLRISLRPGYSVRNDEFQYITYTTMNDEARYIFGKIDQKVLNMSLRINYNITPDLTVQYWGQPFMASGNYSNFKMITDSKADQYEDRYHEFTTTQFATFEDHYEIDEDTDGSADYGFGKPDFNVDEWLSNLVVRWEFLPGSTAYLVWSQSRDFYQASGDFEIWNNLDDLFSDKKANNTFLIKFSYRFGLR